MQIGNRADSNLVASNIKSGVNIFGVAGSYAGEGSEGIAGGVAWSAPNFYANYKNTTLTPAFTNGLDMKFNTDGTEVFLLTSNSLYKAPLTKAYDVTTMGAKTLASAAIQTTNARGMCFNNNGTKLYVIWQYSSVWYVGQYNLSQAYNVTTGVTYVADYAIPPATIPSMLPRSVAFDSTGTKMYILDSANKKIYQFTLSTAWSVEAVTYANKSLALSSYTPVGLFVTPNNSEFFIADQGAARVVKYVLSTAGDISTGSLNSTAPMSDIGTTPLQFIAFKPDGKKIFVGTGTSTFYIYQWNL